MWVRIPRVNFQFSVHLPSKPVVWQHTLHGGFEYALRMPLQHVAQTDGAEPAREHRMPVEEFGVEFVPGYLNFACIQYDDIVTSIDVRRERGLVLAAKDVSDVSSETPQVHIRRIDHIPRTLN